MIEYGGYSHGKFFETPSTLATRDTFSTLAVSQLPECKPLSVRLDRDGAVFHCTHARQPTWKAAFWVGYLTGFLFFAGLLPAIALLYPYANIFATIYADILVTIAAYLLLVGYTGLYFAVFAALMKFVPVRSGMLFPSLAAACIWTTLEWVRSWMITGFPWGSIGYSQWNNLIGNTGRFSLRCTRHQFRGCAF